MPSQDGVSSFYDCQIVNFTKQDLHKRQEMFYCIDRGNVCIFMRDRLEAGGAGTLSLLEAQVDRFMTCLSIGYPDFESELSMAMGVQTRQLLEKVQPIMEKEDLLAIQEIVCSVHMEESIYRYILRLVRSTREHPYLDRGGSPRATISLVRMAKASAWLSGRDYVTPADVMEQFPYIIRHRMRPNAAARVEEKDREALIREILQETEKPVMGLRR